ncbi:hypothetical protein H8B09_10915 [Paenibacillus sp. PR3]|uniref:Uncharacterized protein n=1 Tax=Paenibacillus terricola TaxID=2763503 RepID=A0ABR8MTH0_9BACL|nr:hypothetical protein [Paenibacillus terricola]MBD3919265.1 hypothetical protein [Paenibacillus terricola]
MEKFQFIISDTPIEQLQDSKIFSVGLRTGDETARFRGSLLTLFGDPIWKSTNKENSFLYIIKAVNGKGQSCEFSVYEGAGGIGIGSQSEDKYTFQAAQVFIQQVIETTPSDYEETIIYEDTKSTIVYGCKDGICYCNETPQFPSETIKTLSLPVLEQSQLEEVLAIDFSNIEDPDDIWFWDNNLDHFSDIHFPTIRDLMRKDLSILAGKTINLDEVRQFNIEDGFRTSFTSETPEMALNALAEVWAWRTTTGKATAKKQLDCSAFAWTLSRGVYGFYGGNLNKKHAVANKLYETYEKQLSSQENTIRFFYALLDLFKFKRQFNQE